MTVVNHHPPSVRTGSRFGGPDDGWLRCGGCGELVYRRRLERNLKVCPECAHHGRLSVDERLDLLLDPDSFTRFGAEVVPVDILDFVDVKPYSQRIEESRRRTGRTAAIACGIGRIEESPVVVAVLDFAFLGGSVGGAVGELISRAARRAGADRIPLLIISASGGARMQEGPISLMQLAKTSQELGRLHAEGVLVINLNTDPTYGGATASFSMLGDIVIAEPGARIGFAGPQVIQQTIGQDLPAGFQTAEFLRDNGQIDLVVPRDALRQTLARLLRLHEPAKPAEACTAEPVTEPDLLVTRPAAEVVALARNIERPTTLDYCAYVFDEFIELHGDRLGGGDDPAIVGGLARLAERTVVVIGHQKGHDVGELVRRNFGMPQPWGYHKAHRLMDYAAKFGFPLVTFVDTPGAYPGIEAEQRGQAYAIARCLTKMAGLPVPSVAVVTGEGGSGGALALAVANRVHILENAYLSVISPEGCSTILFGDAASASAAAEQLKLTPPDLLRLGVVDGVIREPHGGAHTEHGDAAVRLRDVLLAAVDELAGTEPADLVEQRYRRFAAFGEPVSTEGTVG